jgi:hypothetical protein
MIVIIGLAVLLVAVIVGVVGVLSNAGAAHPVTENFAVFGYHVTGSTGTLFLFGIVVGAVAMLGMSALLAGARRTAARGQHARRELERSQRETAFVNRDRATLLERQSTSTDAGATMNTQRDTSPDGVQTGRNRVRPFRPWSRHRHPVTRAQRDVTPST